MRRYDGLYRDINNLLSILRSCSVEELVREYFARFNNSAPPDMLRDAIRKLQQKLDNAE